MGDEIKYIQNTLWAMYKESEKSGNAKAYTDRAAELCKRYKDRPELLCFCQNLLISWTPIINMLAENCRNGAV